MTRSMNEESGMTLVESMLAIIILLAGLLMMAQVLAFSVVLSKTYGRDSGKTTASARDKMEELIGLDFADTTTDLTATSPFPATGTGLKAGGSTYPSAPVTGYVDYLNTAGSRTSSGSAAYRRQWQIVDESANSKKLSVSVTSTRSLGAGIAPSTTLVTQKTQ